MYIHEYVFNGLFLCVFVFFNENKDQNMQKQCNFFLN